MGNSPFLNFYKHQLHISHILMIKLMMQCPQILIQLPKRHMDSLIKRVRLDRGELDH